MGQLVSCLCGDEEEIAQISSDDPTYLHNAEPGLCDEEEIGSTKFSAEAVHCSEEKTIDISCDVLEHDLLISAPSPDEAADILQHGFVSAAPTELPSMDSNIAISSDALEHDLLVTLVAEEVTETVNDDILQHRLVNAMPTELLSMEIDQPPEKSELMVKEKEKRCIQIERRIKHYTNSQKILLVGEGDFSFSACLALAFSSASNMVATSLDSKKFLYRNYNEAYSNIALLRSLGCRVFHGVDATEMANNKWLYDQTYDRIIYNFPLAGFFQGWSRKKQLTFNRRLILKFLENAVELLSLTGEIHITHKTNGFYFEWNLPHLASMSGLRLMEEVPFNLNDYEGYNTKYGFGGDDNFNCSPSKTYKFGFKGQSIVK